MTSSGAPYRRTSVLLGVAALCFVWAAGPHLSGRQAAPSLDLFVATASQDRKTAEAALEELGREWRDGYAMILWDIARGMSPPSGWPAYPSAPLAAWPQ
jgi:hypothetical protein